MLAISSNTNVSETLQEIRKDPVGKNNTTWIRFSNAAYVMTVTAIVLNILGSIPTVKGDGFTKCIDVCNAGWHPVVTILCYAGCTLRALVGG